MVEFRDHNDVAGWAKEVSPKARSVFAFRCAARVFPIVGTDPIASGVHLDLLSLRCIVLAVTNVTPFPIDFRAVKADAYDSADFTTKTPGVESRTRSAARSAVYAADALNLFSAARSVESAASSPLSPNEIIGRSDFFAIAAIEAEVLSTGVRPSDFASEPLWPHRSIPFWISGPVQELLDHWKSHPSNAWDFWIDWYEGLLEGRTQDWELWHDIALIDDKHWKAGPEAVAREIERVKAERFVRRARYTEPSPEVELTAVNSLQLDTAASIAAVRQGLETNRQTMPGSYAALQGLIESEIQRLQEDNFLNAEAPDQTKASLRALVAMWDAIEGMKGQVPTDQPTTEQQAEKTAGLLQEYLEAFKKLPQIKKEDVVEGTYQTFGRALRGCLAYGSANLCLLLNAGFPPVIAAAIGASVFIPDVPKSFWEAVRKK